MRILEVLRFLVAVNFHNGCRLASSNQATCPLPRYIFVIYKNAYEMVVQICGGVWRLLVLEKLAESGRVHLKKCGSGSYNQ